MMLTVELEPVELEILAIDKILSEYFEEDLEEDEDLEDEEEDEEPSDWDLEIGFDPYEGCYSWDC